MNKPITSRMHGMLDYPTGLLLIAAPFIFGFTDAGVAAVAIPIALGLMVLVQSLVTDYELSLINLLPLPLHLISDVLAGVALAFSPFVFGFNDEGANAYVPHVAVGVGLIASGLLTRGRRADARGWHSVEPQTRTTPWPDADQPEPDSVDIAQTAAERQRRTTT
jgi:hypothetical protein